jgi:uncharacterized protein YegL
MQPFKPVVNYINHIALVLDASSSMRGLRAQLVKVADEQIAHLAQKSKELDQETRVSIYAFADNFNIKCLVYDKDVLRLPSIATLYNANGNTALIDATLQSLDDLAQTATLYGDHAFLIYVLTDGQENDSKQTPAAIRRRIDSLKENWTLAAFVPDDIARQHAERYGFPKENVAVWAVGEKGLKDVGSVVRDVTDTYMRARASGGFKGTRSLFRMGQVDTGQVKQVLNALHPGQFRVLEVKVEQPIAEFVEAMLKRPYRAGEAYYQLMKPETVQAQKSIALLGKDHRLYVGKEARALLGLPDYEVRVTPEANPDFTVFVQSTSVNRKLIGGTKLVVLS